MSSAKRSESAAIAASSSFVTFFIRIHDEWKVKRSGAIASRARSSAGISVSIVTFELGTICPMRMGLVITPSDRDDRITQRADALDGAFDDVARPHELLRIPARADARGSSGREAVAGLEPPPAPPTREQLTDNETHDARIAGSPFEPCDSRQ